MVLIRIALLGCLAACSQSLFDNNNPNKDGGNTGAEMMVASMCTAPCVGDGGGDFDGSPAGANGRWRYLEDKRDRTWAPMASDGSGGFVGATTANFITVCGPGRTEPACTALPGALLMSSAGATAPADPAIELKAPMNQIVQISVKVFIAPGSLEQTVRLYRNSREDVLYTGVAQPGMITEASITIDALANERILFSLAPTAMGVQYVGVQLFVSGTGAAFPASCQLAVNFSAAMGNTVDNLCGGDFTSTDYNTGAVPPALAAGPFAEQGMGADLLPDKYYVGTNLIQRNTDTTLQFWFRDDMLDPVYSQWLVSDMDLDDVGPGGLGVALYDNGGPKLEVVTCTSGNPLMFVSERMVFPNDHLWHFLRVVQKGGTVNVCFDGKREFTFPAAVGTLQSKYRPHFGRNVVWTPSGAFYDGGLDDVRVFTGALPCE